MIVEYIRYQIPHNEASEFEAAYGAASTQLLAAPECLGYDIARCVDDWTGQPFVDIRLP